MLVSAAVALVPGVIGGGGELLHPHVLALGAVAAIAGSVLPYSLEQVALRRVAPGIFGVLMALEPGAAALAGWIVLGEGLPALSLVGLALVIAAGVAVTRSGRPAPAPEAVAGA